MQTALQHVRHQDSVRVLWVDSICVNQSDLDEKRSQIALMGKIFASATRVLGWLGEATPEVKPAIEFREELVNSAEQFGIDRQPFYRLTGEQRLNGEARAIEEVIKCHELYNLCSIYGKPWFSRMYIAQEAVLAKELTLLCGTHELDWRDFVTSYGHHRGCFAVHRILLQGRDRLEACTIYR